MEGAFLAGFSLGLSLILAIGSQNAFLFKQGLRKQHVFLACLICAVSDALLIMLGVLGFGAVVKQFPEIEKIARFGGAAFLLIYAFYSFRSAWKNTHVLDPAGANSSTLGKTVLVCLALTWLNPHVYLDTVVLLGSVSTQYEEASQAFALGAMGASFLFFFSLGYGARLLSPMFQQPLAWKVLELFVGFIMLSIAISLIVS
ncbi:MAG: LysE/ArgO family amino acid transporter [Gammaproteobacteria bacterium]|nr:LysE/ArgO family amino acid transporter [Gammaproteobacteria bacterium]